MADPICTRNSLVESFPCLSGQLLSERQQQAIRIWFMTQELAANGGTDYSATLASTLIQDAVTLADTMDLSQRRTAVMAIYRDNAVEAGATIPNDTDELLDEVKCFINYPDLDALELLLLCKLGTHKAYPQ